MKKDWEEKEKTTSKDEKRDRDYFCQPGGGNEILQGGMGCFPLIAGEREKGWSQENNRTKREAGERREQRIGGREGNALFRSKLRKFTDIEISRCEEKGSCSSQGEKRGSVQECLSRLLNLSCLRGRLRVRGGV